MKRIFLSLAFILAIGAAFFSFASSKPLAPTYFQADPSNVPNSCEVINCDLTSNQTCTLIKTGFQTYKSENGEPACNTQLILKKHQN